MKSVEIREKLHHYIETAPEKKVKAIFAMVEEEIEETQDFWQNEAFVAEVQRREDAYLKGKAKTYSLEQSVGRATEAAKKIKAK